MCVLPWFLVARYLKRLLHRVDLLKELSEPDASIKETAKRLVQSERAVQRMRQRLVKDGLLNQDGTLTTSGINLLEKYGALSDNVRAGNVLRLHAVIARLVPLAIPRHWDARRERIIGFKVKSWKPAAWTETEFRISDDLRVRTTPKSVLLHLPDFFGTDGRECKRRLLDFMEKAVPEVERLLGVKFRSKREFTFTISQQHFAMMKSTLADFFGTEEDLLRVLDEKGRLRVIVDASKGIFELEAVNKNWSEEDYDRMQRLIEDVVVKEAPLPSEIMAELKEVKELLSQFLNTGSKPPMGGRPELG